MSCGRSQISCAPALCSDGLTTIPRRYIDGFQRRNGFVRNPELVDIIDRLPPPLQQSILRIAQEAGAMCTGVRSLHALR